MKAHSIKQGLLRPISIIIMLVFLGIIGNAQNPNTIKLDIKNDKMNRGEGKAELIINDLYLSEFSIHWYYTDDVTGQSSEYFDRISIDGLHKGTVGVFVYSRSCNTEVFKCYRNVYNDSGSFAAIEVTSRTQTCDNVSAELTVIITAFATAPFEYSWGSDHKTVYASGHYSCEVTDFFKNICIAEIDVSMEKLKCPHDPNMIFGPEGYGDDMMVSAKTKMPYTIEFENDPEFATAPASRVEIEYPIPAEQRMASFRLGDFGFGQFVFTVPNNTSSYYQRLDVSDSLGVWVDVTAGIDVLHNKAFWVFQSIDPATGAEPQSSQLGFLLVNDDEGRGEGYVNYYISPADGLHTGDTTSAVATIVFDDNAPIGTNVWTNMFDAVAPTSTIVNTSIIENDSTNCVISFSSQDDLNGSGVHSVELFVSINGEQYVSAGSYAPESEVNYQLMNGSHYQFISIATDNVGNVEDFKNVPDAVIDYGFTPNDIVLSKYYFYENDIIGSMVGELSTIDVGDIFTYQLVDGEGASDNDLFAISGNRLVTNADFNCEERLDYSVRVRSTDVSNLYVEKAFEISMVKTNQTYNLVYEGDICQGENFVGYGWNINLLDSISGTYSYTRNLQTMSGCDSIRTLTVRIHPEYTTSISDSIVFGEDYTINGFNIENPPIGITYDTLYLQTTYGCDSIILLTLVVNQDAGIPLFVSGYGESIDAGWKFIASPIAGSIAATTVDNIFAATQYDLYYFDQGEELEWRNYKYEPFELVNGLGYLYATKEEQTLVFRGTYNDAETQEVSLVYTEEAPHANMCGWNLIGNPFTTPAYADRSYYTMNEDGTAIEPNAASATTAIPACNGVMVKAEASGETVTFSRATQQNVHSQGCLQIVLSQVVEPVETPVNRGDGPSTGSGTLAHDKAIVSFNTGDQLDKFFFNESKAKLYIPQGGKDLAIATAAEKQGEIPLNFKATCNGEYTISINPDGAEFNYLHLIDNLTGADVDLLVSPEYTFEAKTTDYASRFKLVFSVCGDADGDDENFAFISNGNIVIIGADAHTTLQIVDVLGHVLVSKDGVHTVSTSGMAKGVYVLRLINGDEVRTQKIVIE